jgi:hypothetical protein
MLALALWEAIELVGRILLSILELLDLVWWFFPSERRPQETSAWPRRDWWPGP